MITRDKKIIIRGDLVVGHTYEAVIAARSVPDVYGRVSTQDTEDAPKVSITFEGKLSAPGVATLYSASAGINSIILEWTNPLDYDFDVMEIWSATVPDFSLSTLIATTDTNYFIHNIGLPGSKNYYWLRAKNSSNIPGAYVPTPPAATLFATTNAIGPTDIEDFSITASKTFTKIPILESDVWTNNSPGGGSVAWNTHSIAYNGAFYQVTGANSANKYIYWDVGDTGGAGTVADPYITTYSGTNTAPVMTDTRFIIAMNISGTHNVAWNSIANQVIGTAFILDAAIIEAKIGDLAVTTAKINTLAVTTAKINNLAVTDAKINTLSVAKLTSETITSKTITLATAAGVDTYINAGKTQWDNTQTGFILGIDDTTPKFYIGSTTKYLSWDGSALVVRGTLTADDIQAGGAITGSTFQTAAAVAGHGQRIVLSQADNTIRFHTDTTESVVVIDDDILFNLPGILLTDGIIWMESATFGTSYVLAGEISSSTPDATTALGASASGNAAADIFRLNYTQSGFAGNFVKFLDHNSATKFLIDKSGNIITVGTVDGVDVSAHTHDGEAGNGVRVQATDLLGSGATDLYYLRWDAAENEPFWSAT